MIGSVGRNCKSCSEEKNKSGFSVDTATGCKEVNNVFSKNTLFQFSVWVSFSDLLPLFASSVFSSLHRHKLFCLKASLLLISLASG